MSTFISMDDIHRVENRSSPTPKRRSITKTFDVLIITLSALVNLFSLLFLVLIYIKKQ